MKTTAKFVCWLIWLGILATIMHHWHLGFWPVLCLVVATGVYQGVREGIDQW